MKQTTSKVVTSNDQSHIALFEHESEARTYARSAAQGGCSAYVLKIETEFLASYLPETVSEATRSGATE